MAESAAHTNNVSFVEVIFTSGNWRTIIIAVSLGLLARFYESIFYGIARLAPLDGVDMWADWPFGAIIAVSRTIGVLALPIAFLAKMRADGCTWWRASTLTGWYALGGVVIAALVHRIFVL